jgi:type IV pilus assembly protein PilN
MNVIQQLQESRPEIVHLFDELVASIPDGVFLTGVTQSGNRVEVEGRAQSNARVSAFMRNINASAWIGDPQLLVIENKDQTGTGFSHFRLSFTQQRRTTPTMRPRPGRRRYRDPRPSTRG